MVVCCPTLFATRNHAFEYEPIIRAAVQGAFHLKHPYSYHFRVGNIGRRRNQGNHHRAHPGKGQIPACDRWKHGRLYQWENRHSGDRYHAADNLKKEVQAGQVWKVRKAVSGKSVPRVTPWEATHSSGWHCKGVLPDEPYRLLPVSASYLGWNRSALTKYALETQTGFEGLPYSPIFQTTPDDDKSTGCLLALEGYCPGLPMPE